MNKLYFRALRSSIYGVLAMAALLFVPAGTLDYWQAYVFMVVFVGGSAAITVYLAIKDPKLLERRMNVGPTAEKERTQKIIMVFALLGFIALLVVPALDRRFMWSSVSRFCQLQAGRKPRRCCCRRRNKFEKLHRRRRRWIGCGYARIVRDVRLHCRWNRSQ